MELLGFCTKITTVSRSYNPFKDINGYWYRRKQPFTAKEETQRKIEIWWAYIDSWGFECGLNRNPVDGASNTSCELWELLSDSFIMIPES